MGIIRVLLALSVAIAHSETSVPGLSFFGTGIMAVESFFILSGFYMALVLRTKYRWQTRQFYLARLIRLLPIYWILLFTSVAISAIGLVLTHRPIGFFYGYKDPLPHAWLYPAAAWANFGIVGSDALLLYGDGANIATEHLLAFPLAWTLSIEFAFYAIAPLFLRRRGTVILAVFLFLLGLHRLIWVHGQGHWTAWNYYFTPGALNLFFLGALAYLVYERLPTSARFLTWARPIGWLLFAAVILNILFYRQWGIFGLQDYRYYFLFSASLPGIFIVFKNSRIDRAIGEYSYPFYLAHALVFSLSGPLRHYLSVRNKFYVCLVISALCSWILLLLHAKISRFLHRKLDQRGPAAPSGQPKRAPPPVPAA